MKLKGNIREVYGSTDSKGNRYWTLTVDFVNLPKEKESQLIHRVNKKCTVKIKERQVGE